MHETLYRLVDVISPQQVAELEFMGLNMHPDALRVYGGQVLAQCLAVATATVEDDRPVHSQHAYFLRPGDPGLPLSLSVEKARDGGSFSSRRVVASQKGKPILVSSLSFQQRSEGDVFQGEMPDVPPPESLRSERELGLEAGNIDEKFMICNGPDMDIRVVDPIDWDKLQPRAPRLAAWMKTSGPIADAPGRHPAMLAYMSDSFHIDVCLATHGRHYDQPGFQVASLDHALWFHTDFRADEWLLHVVDTTRTGGGRGLSHGAFYRSDGTLVANSVQQCLMRKH